MEGYIFYLSDMISMLVRGAYAVVLLANIIYFGFVKPERQKFHYGFVYCCLGLLVSLVAGTATRLMQVSTSFYVEHLGTLADMLIIPLFALFGYLLIRQPKRWQQYLWKFVAFEVPYMLAIFVYLSQVKGEEHIVFAHRIESSMIVYTVILCGSCVGLAIFYIHRILKNLPDAYSSLDGRGLTWFRNILITMSMLLLLYLFMNYMFQGSNVGHVHTFYLLMSIFCILDIGINLNWQRAVDFEMLEDVRDLEHHTEDSSHTLDEKLRVAFEDTLGYTRSDITIRHVARMVGTDIHSLSHHLHVNRGMNFTQYIVKLRIGQACRLLAEGKKSVTEVATATGFRQYSTFFHLFKIQTGYSPSDYPRDRETEVMPLPLGKEGETAVLPTDSESHEQAPSNTEPPRQLLLDALNERERHLCQLIAQGLTNEEICEKMEINVSSLRVTRSRLRSKLGLDRKDSLNKYLEKYL